MSLLHRQSIAPDLVVSSDRTIRRNWEERDQVSDLQGSPVVLIGVLNNDWTMCLAGTLRFCAELDQSTGRIRDKQNPSNTGWELSFHAPYLEVTKDYAIVSRVRDPKTEQVAVIVGGIAGWSTMAAGEFVCDPAQFKKIEPFLKKGWEQEPATRDLNRRDTWQFGPA